MERLRVERPLAKPPHHLPVVSLLRYIEDRGTHIILNLWWARVSMEPHMDHHHVPPPPDIQGFLQKKGEENPLWKTRSPWLYYWYWPHSAGFSFWGTIFFRTTRIVIARNLWAELIWLMQLGYDLLPLRRWTSWIMRATSKSTHRTAFTFSLLREKMR